MKKFFGKAKIFWGKLSLARKITLCVLCALLAFDLSLAAKKVASRSSPVVFALPGNDGAAEKRGQLGALNSAAKSRVIKNGRACYTLTAAQRAGAMEFYKAHGDAALAISVSRPGSARADQGGAGGEELPFMFGFLFEGDAPGGRLKKEIGPRPSVGADLRGSEAFDVSMSFPKGAGGDGVPIGFFVYASSPVEISAAAITRASIGYDKSGSVPRFAFPPTGGRIDESARGADFSGGSALFPAQNTLSSVMPKIKIAFSPISDYGSARSPAKSVLNFGGERKTVFRAKGRESLEIPAAALKNPYAQAFLEDSGGQPVVFMMVASSENLAPDSCGGKVIFPIKTDPGLILDWPERNWRTALYELFEWDRFPGVLFFDFKNYSVQDDFLRRLAFFVEKAGYRGRLLDDSALEGKHGYNAHDYKSDSLAEFFTKAERENFLLNESERLLRDILLARGVIVSDGGGYSAGGGAVISISRESNEGLRYRLLAHEGWHGIYFTDERFRNVVSAVYGTIDGASREFITRYWGTQADLSYDVNDDYLAQNEFMAYLMQQPLSSVAQYFVHLASRGSVMRAIPALAADARERGGVPFEDAARVLDEFAFDNYSLVCGRIALVW